MRIPKLGIYLALLGVLSFSFAITVVGFDNQTVDELIASSSFVAPHHIAPAESQVFKQDVAESTSIATGTIGGASARQTYKNEKYGYEFQYPTNWTIDEDEYDDFNIAPPGDSGPGITMTISPVKNLGPYAELKCPFLEGETECKLLTNAEGFPYIRSIAVEAYPFQPKTENLTGSFRSPKVGIWFSTSLTGRDGNPDQLSPQTVKVFDGILATFTFTN